MTKKRKKLEDIKKEEKRKKELEEAYQKLTKLEWYVMKKFYYDEKGNINYHNQWEITRRELHEAGPEKLLTAIELETKGIIQSTWGGSDFFLNRERQYLFLKKLVQEIGDKTIINQDKKIMKGK